MFFLPFTPAGVIDPFNAYLDGREEANKANWNDLDNTERLADMRRTNAFGDQTFDGRVAATNALYDNNVMTNAINRAAQPGKVAMAGLGSDAGVQLANGLQPMLPQLTGDQITGIVNKSAYDAGKSGLLPKQLTLDDQNLTNLLYGAQQITPVTNQTAFDVANYKKNNWMYPEQLATANTRTMLDYGNQLRSLNQIVLMGSMPGNEQNITQAIRAFDPNVTVEASPEGYSVVTSSGARQGLNDYLAYHTAVANSNLSRAELMSRILSGRSMWGAGGLGGMGRSAAGTRPTQTEVQANNADAAQNAMFGTRQGTPAPPGAYMPPGGMPGMGAAPGSMPLGTPSNPYSMPSQQYAPSVQNYTPQDVANLDIAIQQVLDRANKYRDIWQQMPSEPVSGSDVQRTPVQERVAKTAVEQFMALHQVLKRLQAQRNLMDTAIKTKAYDDQARQILSGAMK